MRTVRILIVALIGSIAVAACSDTPESIDDAVSSLPGEDDVAELGADIQAEIDAVSTAIENSEAADELRDGWSDMQAELDEAMNAIASNEAVDTDAIRAELDEFQAQVEAASDDVSDELVSAWNELRAKFEQLIS